VVGWPGCTTGLVRGESGGDSKVHLGEGERRSAIGKRGREEFSRQKALIPS